VSDPSSGGPDETAPVPPPEFAEVVPSSEGGTLAAAMTLQLPPPEVQGLHTAALSASERRDAWLEVAVATCVGMLPPLYSALVAHTGWRQDRAGSAWIGVSVNYLVHNLTVAAPILWIIHRSRPGWAYYGIVRLRALRDFLWGLAVLAMMFGLVWGTWGVMWVASFVPMVRDLLTLVPGAAATSAGVIEARNAPWPLFLISMTITTSVEELFTRAYLVPALARLWRSPWPACGAAAAMMASYHIYQGSYAVLVIFFSQWALNGVFWRYRRIWPFMLAHACYDGLLFMSYRR
jgi:membrane protease YdiL (CAAX protease family)